MKKTQFIVLFLLASICTFLEAQNYSKPPNLPHYDIRKWHFGFTVGPEFQNMRITNNSSDVIGYKGTTDISIPESFVIDESNLSYNVESAYYYSDMSSLSTGFHVGIITSRRLGEYLNLRMIPTLSLGQKTVESKLFVSGSDSDGNLGMDEATDPNDGTSSTISTKIKSTYVACPILIKYKAVRINNFRPYMIAGINAKYDLATDHEENITLKKGDLGLEFGLGSDFYLQEFRFGLEIRFGIGLLNVYDDNRPVDEPMPYISASIDQIKARTLTVSLNFE